MPSSPAPAYVRDVEQTYLRQLWERRDFALYLAWGRIRSANANSVLGIFWWVLNPLLLALVYLLVFGVILRTSRGQPDYLAYLITGIFTYYYTREAAASGATSITSNIRLLANLSMPKLIMPIAVIIQAMVGFGASLVVALVINAAYAGIYPGWQFLYLIPAFVIHTVFNFGLAALFARLAVVVADLTNIIPYALRIWLYMSPIIWPLSFFEQAPEQIQTILRLNPMFGMIGMYRSALLGYPIVMADLWWSLAWATVVGLVGITVFVRSERTMMRGQ